MESNAELVELELVKSDNNTKDYIRQSFITLISISKSYKKYKHEQLFMTEVEEYLMAKNNEQSNTSA